MILSVGFRNSFFVVPVAFVKLKSYGQTYILKRVLYV